MITMGRTQLLSPEQPQNEDVQSDDSQWEGGEAEDHLSIVMSAFFVSDVVKSHVH